MKMKAVKLFEYVTQEAPPSEQNALERRQTWVQQMQQLR